MELTVKHFSELTTLELYDILRARVAVFVVEQECPYQELDGDDLDAFHLMLRDGDELVAYVRVYPRGEDQGRVGRVITLRRGKGLGKIVMEAGVELVRDRLGKKQVYIEAQCYAIGFYEKVGFRVASEEFMEDGIPHVVMLRDL